MYNINMNIVKGSIYKKGYTNRELATLLDIHEQTLSNWINNRNIEHITKFINLLILLDIDIEDIKKELD